MNLNYENCCKFIESVGNITLFPHQKDIIRGWCEGKEVRTCRGAGRSTLAKEFGKYVVHVLDSNDYNADPEVIIPYNRVVESGILSDNTIKQAREELTKEQFEREFCVKY